jgi:hypothetical protein
MAKLPWLNQRAVNRDHARSLQDLFHGETAVAASKRMAITQMQGVQPRTPSTALTAVAASKGR